MTTTDRIAQQTLAEFARHRVRMPGYYNAVAAQMLYEDAPDEFDAEQVGIDSDGEGVYVMFWRTPRRAQA